MANSKRALAERCSEACTRSGLVILLLALLGVLVGDQVEQDKNLAALRWYLFVRQHLAASLGAIERDRCWQHVVEEGWTPATVPESWKQNQWTATADLWAWPLGQLLDIECTRPVEAGTDAARRKIEDAPAPGADATRPSPPTFLESPRRIPAVLWIVDALEALGDGERLQRVRQISLEHDTSVFRWIELWRDLVYETGRRHRTFFLEPQAAPTPRPSRFVPTVGRATIERFITLTDAKHLAELEMPPMFRGSEPAQVELPSLPVRVPIAIAPLAILAALAVALAHFLAYYWEAKAHAAIRSPGTIFSVFRRNWITRSAFVVMALTPLLGAIRLASVMEFARPLAWALAACVAVLELPILWDLVALPRLRWRGL